MPWDGRRAALILLMTASCRVEAPAPPSVQPAGGEIVAAAWADPSHFGPGGGQTQLVVRVKKRDGSPAAGVEVRFRTSTGALFSKGSILRTDARGMTRDRLTLSKEATVTIEIGGVVKTLRVPVEGGN